MAKHGLVSTRTCKRIDWMDRVTKGCVHGRFQPFHNGHLDYVLQAFEKASFISVGLTQIFMPRPTDDVKSRNSAAANPLSFLQRSRLVTSALTSAGIERARFDIVPFPIETPTRLREFIAQDVTCFTTELNLWNSEKIRLLEREGYVVVRLRVSNVDDVRITSGTNIRKLIRQRDDSWRNFVPEAVHNLISHDYLSAFTISEDETSF